MAPREIDARAADPEIGRALWEQSEAVLARAAPRDRASSR
jgi:hypothetical protein